MVLMAILLPYYEDAIKSWSGCSRRAFLLLAVYMTVAWILRDVFRRKLSEMLGHWARFSSSSFAAEAGSLIAET